MKTNAYLECSGTTPAVTKRWNGEISFSNNNIESIERKWPIFPVAMTKHKLDSEKLNFKKFEIEFEKNLFQKADDTSGTVCVVLLQPLPDSISQKMQNWEKQCDRIVKNQTHTHLHGNTHFRFDQI